MHGDYEHKAECCKVPPRGDAERIEAADSIFRWEMRTPWSCSVFASAPPRAEFLPLNFLRTTWEKGDLKGARGEPAPICFRRYPCTDERGALQFDVPS